MSDEAPGPPTTEGSREAESPRGRDARRSSDSSEPGCRRSPSRSTTPSASSSPRRADVRATHPGLEADTRTDDAVTIAGRVVLKRDIGKLKFLVAPRSRAATCSCGRERGRLAERAVRAARRGRPRRHHRRRPGAVGTTRRGELSVVRRPVGDAHEGAPALAGEVARAAGPRPPAASAVPAPDRRRSTRAARRWRARPCCGRCAGCSTSAGSSSSRGRCCSSSPAARTRGRSPRTTRARHRR